MQRSRVKNCPLCRNPDAVDTADGTAIDHTLGHLVKQWFPLEVAAKKKSDAKEIAREANIP